MSFCGDPVMWDTMCRILADSRETLVGIIDQITNKMAVPYRLGLQRSHLHHPIRPIPDPHVYSFEPSRQFGCQIKLV